MEVPCASGHPNPVEARFCQRCGQPLERPDTATRPDELPPEAPTGLVPDAADRPTALLPSSVGPSAPDPTPPSPLFTGALPDDDDGRPRARANRGLRWAIGLVVVALIAAGAAYAVVGLRRHQVTRTTTSPPTSGLSPPTPGQVATPAAPAPSPASSPTGSSSTTSGTSAAPGGAAAQIASVVSQSAQVRPGVSTAIAQVASCTITPAQGEQPLQAAVATRASALSTLGQVDPSGLTDGSQLVADLTQALQASSQADQDYLAWMMDGPSCSSDPDNDSQYAAGDQASAQADQAKAAFVALWDPIARADGEPTVQATDF